MMTETDLTRKFDTLWRQIGGPELEREVRFHPRRRFKFDRASRVARVAVELDGGTWVGGRHVSGVGFARDCEKLNLAILAGYVVFRFTTDMLDTDPAGHLEPVAEFIRERLKR